MVIFIIAYGLKIQWFSDYTRNRIGCVAVAWLAKSLTTAVRDLQVCVKFHFVSRKKNAIVPHKSGTMKMLTEPSSSERFW